MIDWIFQDGKISKGIENQFDIVSLLKPCRLDYKLHIFLIYS
jgi:hypothetical protein